MPAKIRTTVQHDGQRYVDEPIYRDLRPREELRTDIAASVAAAFGHPQAKAIREVVGHERVRLRWMKPDGKGGLVPKNKNE